MTLSKMPDFDGRNAVLDIITGTWKSQALYAAVKLGIPELINEGCHSSQTLAKVTGANPEGIRRLLRLLVSIGVFGGSETSGYSINSVSKELLAKPNSLRQMCLLYGEECYRAWSQSAYSVQNLKSGFEKEFDEPFYQYLSKHDDIAKRFQDVMNAQNVFASYVADIFEFSDGKHVVDVGCGGGELMANILLKHSSATGTLFDKSHMIPQARNYVEAVIDVSRVQFVVGDMFQNIPINGDVYLFSRVLAGWPDQEIVGVLKKCRNAIRDDHSRIIILDRLVREEGTSVMSALWDLHLLVTIGGGLRSFESYEYVLRQAEFKIERTEILPDETTAIIAAPIAIKSK